MTTQLQQVSLFDLPPALDVDHVPRRRRRVRRACEQMSLDLERHLHIVKPLANEPIAPGMRFDIEHLVEWLGRQIAIDEQEHVRRELADRIGMTQRNLRRRIMTGWINGDTADRWATQCGTHPTRVWADFYRDVFLEDGWPLNICEDCESPLSRVIGRPQRLWHPCATCA